MLLQTIEALFRKYRLFCYRKLFAAVRDWCGAGHLAVFTTQVPHEGSDLAVYEVGRAAKALPGVLEAHDMTPEATAVKLMWVLGQTQDLPECRRLFYKTINHDLLFL